MEPNLPLTPSGVTPPLSTPLTGACSPPIPTQSVNPPLIQATPLTGTSDQPAQVSAPVAAPVATPLATTNFTAPQPLTPPAPAAVIPNTPISNINVNNRPISTSEIADSNDLMNQLTSSMVNAPPVPTVQIIPPTPTPTLPPLPSVSTPAPATPPDSAISVTPVPAASFPPTNTVNAPVTPTYTDTATNTKPIQTKPFAAYRSSGSLLSKLFTFILVLIIVSLIASIGYIMFAYPEDKLGNKIIKGDIAGIQKIYTKFGKDLQKYFEDLR